MVLSDASDIIGGKKEAPTLVHLVAMSVNKENGDLEGWEDLVHGKPEHGVKYSSMILLYAVASHCMMYIDVLSTAPDDTTQLWLERICYHTALCDMHNMI